MTNLAILGGPPVIPAPFPPYRSIGEAERRAILDVVDSGCLSGFYGSPGGQFYGGPKVRACERAWQESTKAAHALTLNSATSALMAAMGAIGIGPGDEIIVPPTTMSATAMAGIFYGGIPVFADIESSYFTLDPARAAEAIGPKTRAMVVTNLFGHPGYLSELRALADRHGIYLIEDSAQAPLAFEGPRRAGTVGHIGVYSLNYHKHIHSGEGGVCVTSDADLAKRIAAIRNHAENCADAIGIHDGVNMVGLNLRMTEIEAAICIEQLKNAEMHVARRERIAERLTRGVRGLAGIEPPAVREGCRHNYYCWVAKYDAGALGVPRELFSRALEAEGFPNAVGYVPPLYRLPIFQRRVAIGRAGFPFSLSNRDYADGLCPVAEGLHAKGFLLFETCASDIDDAGIDLLVEAFRKVHAGVDSLRALDRQRRSA